MCSLNLKGKVNNADALKIMVKGSFLNTAYKKVNFYHLLKCYLGMGIKQKSNKQKKNQMGLKIYATSVIGFSNLALTLCLENIKIIMTAKFILLKTIKAT